MKVARRFAIAFGLLGGSLVACPSGATSPSNSLPRLGERYAQVRPGLLAQGFKAMLIPGPAQDTSPCRDWTAKPDCQINSFPEGRCATFLDPCTFFWQAPDGKVLRISTEGLPGTITSVAWTDRPDGRRGLAERKPFSKAQIEMATAQTARGCLGSLAEPLVKGDMSGLFDCRDGDIKIRFVGRTTGPIPYRVYDWRYIAYGRPGTSVHGGQRILLFDDHMTYVGQYFPDGIHCASVRGSSVYLNLPPNHGNVIHLNGRHPPWVVWLDGDQAEFFR